MAVAAGREQQGALGLDLSLLTERKKREEHGVEFFPLYYDRGTEH
jgi:hypothetical protein